MAPQFLLDPPLTGPRVTIRNVGEDDVAPLLAIVNEPEVRRWWGGVDPEDQIEEFEDGFAILVAGAHAGWLGAYEENEPDYRHAALDIMLTTPLHGQGLGPETLRVMIRHLITRGHHRFTIDPAATNERAIGAYASVGFKPVGLMRDYERGLDGTWHDGLLMDLLARELIDG